MAKSIEFKRLANGLPLLKVAVAGTASACLLALIKVGSRLETSSEQGLSHFLEHMLFKGTATWPTAKELTGLLDGVGAEYNAYTAKEYTGYYIKVAAEYLPLAAQVLQEMFWQSRLDETEMNKEKNVIVEEINMYEDNPLLYINDVLEGALYQGSSLGNLISGSRASVTNLRHNQLKNFWQRYYHPHNMTLTMSGKISPTVEKKVRQIFSQSRTAGNLGRYQTFKPQLGVPRVAVHFKDTEQVQLAYAFPSYGYGHKNLPTVRLLAVILGGNMSSRLFVRLREKEGLCYSVRCSTDQYFGTGSLVIQAGLDKSRLELAIQLIREELAKVAQNGVTDDELIRAKEYTKGSLTLAMEDSLAQAEWAGKRYFLEGSFESAHDYLQRLSLVKLTDIKKVARQILQTNRPTLALIGPYKNSKPFTRLLT
ncbi:MAG: insulinase family protein [Candidatus Kerfeldbacteria bacterium]|nr:insulinase family protein [Candidatus Kerfeldbacteria bacterium]